VRFFVALAEVHDNIGAIARETQGDRAPDTARASGDECDSPGERPM
jgi:hypothetical protein